MLKNLFCEDISVEYEFKSLKFKGVVDRLIMNNLDLSGNITGYIVMLRARMFRSLIPVLMIKERDIRARNITI